MDSIGYKLLGYGVWQGAKWYVRRRYSDVVPKAAAIGAAVAIVAGVALAGRQAASRSR